jgi:putative transposase
VNVKRLNDGSCIRLRPAYPNHVPQRPAGRCSLGEWIIRLLADDGPMTLLRTAPIVRRRRTIRCKAPRPGGLGGTDAGSACLTSSTSSPARAWRSGSAASSTRSTSSTSCPTCSPCGDRQLCCRWENGYCESFNARLRDELLNGEIFTTLKRGQDRDRELAKARQQRPPALLTRLPPAGT